MMMLYLPVLGAFATVLGMIAFLVYCGREFDAEQARVDGHRSQ